MPWTTEQKIFIVEAYFQENSIHAAQLQFKNRFGCCKFPVHSMIYRWVNMFRTHGTVLNLYRKDTNRQSHSGQPKSRAPRKVVAVRDSVVCSPGKSLRRRSQELGINQECLCSEFLSQILTCILTGYRSKQKLTPDDMKKQVTICHWFSDNIDAVPDFLDNVWFSNEAHFLLSGHVNSKNNIFGVPHCLSTVCKDHYTP